MFFKKMNTCIHANPNILLASVFSASCGPWDAFKNKSIRDRMMFVDYCSSSFQAALGTKFFLHYIPPLVAPYAKQLLSYDIQDYPLEQLLSKYNIVKTLVANYINSTPIWLCNLITNFNQLIVISIVVTIGMEWIGIKYSKNLLIQLVQMVIAVSTSLVLTSFVVPSSTSAQILLGILLLGAIIIAHLFKKNPKIPEKVRKEGMAEVIKKYLDSKPSKSTLIDFGEKSYIIKLNRIEHKLLLDYFALTLIYLRKNAYFKSFSDYFIIKLLDMYVSRKISKLDQETQEQIKDFIDNPEKRKLQAIAEKFHSKKLNDQTQKSLVDYLTIAMLYLRSESTMFASWTNFCVEPKFDEQLTHEICSWINQ